MEQGTGALLQALWEAAQRGHADLVSAHLKTLTDAGAFNFDHVKAGVEAACDVAIRNDWIQVVQVFVQRHPQYPASFDIGRKLAEAVRLECTSVVECLAQAKADVNERYKQAAPIHRAVCASLVAALVRLNASVNARDRYSSSPLHRIIYKPEHTIPPRRLALLCRTLIAARADVNARGFQRATPLLCSVKGRCWAAVRVLAQANGDVNATDGCGFTPLQHAACTWYDRDSWDVCLSDKQYDCRRQFIVRTLIEYKADLNATLIEKKADFDARDASSWTAFDFAVQSGCRPDIADMLAPR